MLSTIPLTLRDDDAQRWLLSWQQLPSSARIEEALDDFLSAGGSPDIARCQQALAAAELVAAAFGHPANGFPEKMRPLLAATFAEAELRQKALSVIDMVQSDSELRQRWAKHPAAANWVAALRNLAERLR
jgi:hypothetical protein